MTVELPPPVQKTLTHFLSCAFTEDWNDEFETPEQAVKGFLIIDPPSQPAEIANALQLLLNLPCTDAELWKMIHQLGSMYYIEGEKAREWIGRLIGALKSSDRWQ